MKYKSYLLPLLLLLFVISSCVSSKDKNNIFISTNNLSTPINTFENAKLYLSSGDGGEHFKIAVLKGGWHEMGGQYGYLFHDLIKEFYEGVVSDSGMTYSYLKTKSEMFYDNCSHDEKELISGLAETSGLSLEQQKILYSITEIIHYSPYMDGCSQISAWGAYTGGHPLVIGRNYDLLYPFTKYQKYVCVVVYCPTGSTNSAASVNFIATPPRTFFNSSGIYIASNTGVFSDPAYINKRMEQFSSAMFSVVFDCSTITNVNAILLKPANLPYRAFIHNVADANECRVYELFPNGSKVRTGNGFVVASNHFIIPEWTGLQYVFAGPISAFTMERFNNMNNLVEQYKGSIDAQQMMRIFERTLSEGGPTFDPGTIFQVVTVPSAKIMWIKAPGYSMWEKIDFNLFF